MPYNYPELSTLLSMKIIWGFVVFLFCILDELNKVQNSNVTKSWQNRFDAYLRAIPPYYIPVN